MVKHAITNHWNAISVRVTCKTTIAAVYSVCMRSVFVFDLTLPSVSWRKLNSILDLKNHHHHCSKCRPIIYSCYFYHIIRPNEASCFQSIFNQKERFATNDKQKRAAKLGFQRLRRKYVYETHFSIEAVLSYSIGSLLRGSAFIRIDMLPISI